MSRMNNPTRTVADALSLSVYCVSKSLQIRI
ncbi:TPA_asm: hypothetical protein [Porphyromonas phage phage023a_KCOM2797]|uniref:Uncharacterized protein n=2 Tax=Schifferlevirus TaxID=3425076 RepID=A0AAT9JDH4_9CAUD